MKKIVLLFIVTIAVNISAQESVILRYNFKKGDVYQIKMMMSQDMGAVMSQKTGTIMTQKTIDILGDSIVNETKIDKMVMDITQGGQTMSYDSSKKDEELDERSKMMKTQMDPILSAVITTKTTSLGNVLDVSVTPRIPQVEQIGKQNSNVVYPKEAVKVGSTWSTTKKETGMILKFDYTVKSISDNEVVLDIGGNVSGIGTGTLSGNMNIDKASGVSTFSKIQMKMNVQGQELLIDVEGIIEKQ